ncbi:unnamed protein product [Calypogeia fissa]
MIRPKAAAGGLMCLLLLLLPPVVLPALPCSRNDEFGRAGSFGASNVTHGNVDLLPFMDSLLNPATYRSGGDEFFARDERPGSRQAAAGTDRFDMESRSSPGEEGGADGTDRGDRDREGTVRAVGEVANEYIVRFNEYRHASVHRQALEQVLGTNGWNWVERRNPAAAFPTDFGLLRIQDDGREALLSQLAGVSFVRDVSPQMQFTRALTSEPSDSSSTRSSNTKKKNTEEKKSFGSKSRGRREGGVGRWTMEAPEAEERVEKYDKQGELGQCEGKVGRRNTAMSFEDDELLKREPAVSNATLKLRGRSLLGMERSQITSMFEAEKLWARGYTGEKVKMAVFDTGVRADHPHFRNIKERTNWTNEKDILNDNLGHGTFVAGVISSQDPQCLGFAPDAEIYAFRVFTDAQVSYTSWFLDAFNYAIATKMNVLNLSIGGPDYLDSPFVEKVWEMTANNIIMVSAIGNDGPLYGTLNNPADQSDVIGVGGIDYSDHIASFSSRGMSTWELPHGYGRVKPDIVAYGREVVGSKITTGCKSLSGTSVASPVVAGAVCLLASVVPEHNRWDILNPASMKQALIEGATQLVGPNIYEQGAGRLNLLKSFEILLNYKPRASIHPRVLDLTDCPYLWPFCRQPLYHGAMPVIFNATILNGMGVVGYIESHPTWMPAGAVGHLLDIQFTYSDVIWPWTGYLGLHFRIKPEGSKFSGTLEGNISFTIISPAGRGEDKPRRWDCVLPVKVAVIPTPLREKRILWDQFHSIRYPPGYIPRDSLDVRNDILDWHGDHIHTNFHGMFNSLRDAGYYVENLGSPLTCFDATQYGTLLMVDLEDEYHVEEIEKLRDDVETHGLGLIVFADWYHLDTMVKMRFFDDNTRSWWTPATGGANVPALNDLLYPFGIAFGDTILNGAYSIGGERAHYASGTDIIKFPAGGYVHRFLFEDSSGGNAGITSTRTGVKAQVESPILGAVEAGKGRIAVYGDSNCLDSSHMVTNCYWLLKKLIDFTSYKIMDSLIFSSTNELGAPIGTRNTILPTRRTDINFSAYSLVLGHQLQCGMDAPLVVQGSKGFLAQTENARKRFHRGMTPGSNSVTQRQSMANDLGYDDESLSASEEATSGSGLPASGSDKTGSDMSLPQLSSDYEIDNSVQIEGINMTTLQDGDSGGQLYGNTLGKDGAMLADVQQIERITEAVVHREKKKQTEFVRFHQKEPESPGSLFQWVVPVSLCGTGFLLIWSLWRVRQKKPRRMKKGSKSSLLSL